MWEAIEAGSRRGGSVEKLDFLVLLTISYRKSERAAVVAALMLEETKRRRSRTYRDVRGSSW